MTALLKPQMTRSGPPGEGCWAFDNTHDPSTVSEKFYGLVVPDKQVPQLDNLSWREEAEFWELNFAVASTAIERLDHERDEAHVALMGVNDGYYSGQSIPHVHSHIFVTEQTAGADEFSLFRRTEQTMDALRRAFSPAAHAPLYRTHLMCDVFDFGEFASHLRYKREALREKGLDNFRIYLGSPFRPQFRKIFFALDASNADNPMFSFSNAWRTIHERSDYKSLAHPLSNPRFTHFEPVVNSVTYE